MPYSREELVLFALNVHGVPGTGQTASAEEQQFVDLRVDGVMADLAERNIYTWGDPDSIDDAACLHLAAVIAQAGDIPRYFGSLPDEQARLMAEKRLRELKQVVLSGQAQRVDYF